MFTAKRRCPTNYRFSAALNFCYLLVPILADFQTAMDHCEGIGARLAVLPTMAHVDYLKAGLFYIIQYQNERIPYY